MTPVRTIVLLDPFGSVDDVVESLGADSEMFRVVAATEIPRGSDAFALMLGPETTLTEEDVRSLPELKIVAVTSTGFDHVPVGAVSAHGAWTTTAAGYCTDEVADHALALLLGGIRGLTALDAQVRAGEWDVTAVAPRRIAGATVGLLGFGRIAQTLAQRLTALGVHVRAYDPIAPQQSFLDLGVEQAATALDALRDCDAVSLHIPLTPETERTIDAGAIQSLRPGTFVVNVARGGLVDEAALADALESGHLSGAGLDVFATEPLPENDRLRTLPTVTLSPHGAWFSQSAERRLFSLATGSIVDVAHNRHPYGAVASPTIA